MTHQSSTSLRSLVQLTAVVGALAAATPVAAASATGDLAFTSSEASASSDPDRDDSAPAILYLNRGGGTFRPGADDPAANTTSLVKRAVTIPAWNVDRRSWTKVLDCTRDMVDRWHVEVTDVDPGNVPHYEVVIGGNPSDAGLAATLAGVAPFSNECRALSTAVAFTFVDLIDSDLQVVCEVAVHEFAHTIGLDHEVDCHDPMSYLRGCGDKEFQDVEARCGEGTPRECLCGGDTQNSVELLDARLGRRGHGNPAPTVEVDAPADGAVVGPGFAVEASAFDNAGIDEVELWIDGELTARSDSEPFRFTTDDDLASGRHQIEIRAIDAGGAVGSQLLDVTLERAPTEIPSAAPAVDEPTTSGCAAGGDSGAAMILAVAGVVATLRRRARA